MADMSLGRWGSQALWLISAAIREQDALAAVRAEASRLERHATGEILGEAEDVMDISKHIKSKQHPTHFIGFRIDLNMYLQHTSASVFDALRNTFNMFQCQVHAEIKEGGKVRWEHHC